MSRMAQVDSGHESLVSDECCTPPHLDSLPPVSAPTNRPPRITPFSGVLGKGKVVVRPVAFKPTMTPSARFSNAGERYGSTPILARPGSQLTLYGSNNDLRNNHGRNSNYSLDRKLLSSCTSMSMSSSPPLAMASLSSLPLSSGRRLNGYESLENVRKSPISNSTQNIHSNHINHSNHNLHTNQNHIYRSKCSPFHLHSGGDGGSLLDLTPSPSDSGVVELEAALRERDAELVYLRQTMEHNEQVIVRVYQEKERVWERELRRMKSAHENRLRAGAQKTLKLEQMLMMQTYQLQEDKKRLKDEAAHEASELRQEIALLRGRLEETEWGLCQKTGELTLLKTQLKDAQVDQTSKVHELIQLRSQLRDRQVVVEQREDEIAGLQLEAVERSIEMTSLRKEIERLTAENQEIRSSKELHEAEIARLRTEIQCLDKEKKEAAHENRINIESGQTEIVKLEEQVSKLSKELEVTKLGCGSKRWAGEWTQREEVDHMEAEMQDMKSELTKTTEDKKVLDVETKRLEKVLEEERCDFERERVTWAQEKEKVLRYQRQLQLNYVQMFRRTRTLETEVESLTLELEMETKGVRANTNQKQLPAIEMGHTIEL